MQNYEMNQYLVALIKDNIGQMLIDDEASSMEILMMKNVNVVDDMARSRSVSPWASSSSSSVEKTTTKNRWGNHDKVNNSPQVLPPSPPGRRSSPQVSVRKSLGKAPSKPRSTTPPPPPRSPVPPRLTRSPPPKSTPRKVRWDAACPKLSLSPPPKPSGSKALRVLDSTPIPPPPPPPSSSSPSPKLSIGSPPKPSRKVRLDPMMMMSPTTIVLPPPAPPSPSTPSLLQQQQRALSLRAMIPPSTPSSSRAARGSMVPPTKPGRKASPQIAMKKSVSASTGLASPTTRMVHLPKLDLNEGFVPKAMAPKRKPETTATIKAPSPPAVFKQFNVPPVPNPGSPPRVSTRKRMAAQRAF